MKPIAHGKQFSRKNDLPDETSRGGVWCYCFSAAVVRLVLNLQPSESAPHENSNFLEVKRLGTNGTAINSGPQLRIAPIS